MMPFNRIAICSCVPPLMLTSVCAPMAPRWRTSTPTAIFSKSLILCTSDSACRTAAQSHPSRHASPSPPPPHIRRTHVLSERFQLLSGSWAPLRRRRAQHLQRNVPPATSAGSASDTSPNPWPDATTSASARNAFPTAPSSCPAQKSDSSTADGHSGGR